MIKYVIYILLFCCFITNSYGQENPVTTAVNKYKEGDTEGALKMLDSLIILNSKDTLAYKYKYQIHYYNDNEIKAFSTIKKIYPLKEACFKFANLCFKNKNYVTAINYYNKAIKEDAAYEDALFNRGICKFYTDKKEEAKDDYELVICINPNYMEVYNSLGNLYSSEYDYDKAIETYNEAIKINPKYKTAFYNKGLVEFKQKKYDNAIISYNKAITIDNDFKEALYNRGLAKLKVGNEKNRKSACDDFNKSSKLGYERAKNVAYWECN